MKRVILESPYAGDTETNARYLRECLLDCLRRGESPYASHGLLTQALNDSLSSERNMGIQAGFAWRHAAEATVVYTNLGITKGMLLGIEHAARLGHQIEYRTLEGWNECSNGSSRSSTIG